MKRIPVCSVIGCSDQAEWVVYDGPNEKLLCLTHFLSPK